jgi:hypothetical protein
MRLAVAKTRNAFLRNFNSGETSLERRLPVLIACLLGGYGRIFLLCLLACFGLFLRGFLLRGLRGFIAHNVGFLLLG